MKFLKKLDHIYSARTINNFAQLKNSYNNVQTLCADPFIGIIDNVLDEYETNYYIDFFQGSQRNGYSIEAMIDSELTGNYINANRQQRKNYNRNLLLASTAAAATCPDRYECCTRRVRSTSAMRSPPATTSSGWSRPPPAMSRLRR